MGDARTPGGPVLIDAAPSARVILQLLHEAGPGGITGTDMARCFTRPARLDRRLCWVYGQLTAFWAAGYACRAQAREPSPHYHHAPVWRWFITAEGSAHLARELRPPAAFERASRTAERALERERAAVLLAVAARQYGPSRYGQGIPPCERNRVIAELRSQGCTYAAIGDIFGITRERVRQVVQGIYVTPCTCPRCAPERWPVSGVGDQAPSA